MFTQCSKCETVFRLSAEALRAAGGQVRCGRCGEVFNALARLAEDATGFTTGESPLDMETRADQILGSAAPEIPQDTVPPPPDAQIGAHPGVEFAQLRFIDPPGDELTEDTSLEFTLPPGELDRIFIETRPSPLQQLAAEGTRAERDEAHPPVPAVLTQMVPPQPLSPPQPHSPQQPVSPQLPQQPPAPRQPHSPQLHPHPQPPHPPQQHSQPQLPQQHSQPQPPQSPPQLHSHPEHSPVAANGANENAVSTHHSSSGLSQDHARNNAPLTRIAGLEVSEDVRQEMLSSYAYAELPQINAPQRRLPFAAWLAAAVVLAVLLVAQIIRGNGEWLAVHAPLLGGSAAAANLSSYQLRQWGVTGDPGAKGMLRVRASIMNTTAQLQPYPLLRVTLANRFGTRVGAREFEPAEYLGRPTARLLAPSERVDATLDILDPGKDAEGFEIDVCVRSPDRKIMCAGDAAAQAR